MGAYGQVSYEVHNSTPKEAQDAFSIDANTGELTLKQNALELSKLLYNWDYIILKNILGNTK